MKKLLLSLFMCICLITAFTACGDTSSTSSEDVDGVTTEDTVTEDASDENSSEESSILADPTADFTMEQKNAYRSGQSYLENMPFSKQKLIDQLSSEYGDQYPRDVAEFAVEQLEANGVADWDAECEESARSYLDMMAFSKQELIDQLTSEYGEQFTQEQAERAVEKVYQ